MLALGILALALVGAGADWRWALGGPMLALSFLALALVGAYPPGGFTIDPSSIMSMGRRIVGVVEGGIDPQLFIPRLITYYREGRLPLEKLIKRYAFADLEAAFAASESGAVIKPVVLMPQD